MEDLRPLSPPGSTQDPDRKPLTVSELTAQVRFLLEDRFPRVWVEGEISNWTVAASGHAYFALKDGGAVLSCVMWRSSLSRTSAQFRDGDQVEARGRLSLFERRGQYQLVADSLQQKGAGALWQKFLEMKARLEAEGLFDPDRKRRIPTLPNSIGIVTSPTGAAVRDMLNVLKRRAPGIPVTIWPAKVQGRGAATELIEGVRKLGGSGRIDVLIIGRGGGSLEDLWEFNDEGLARAIAACPVPVISAVGHEVDFSISDFVADLRAPTPSAAAELVSADHAQFQARIRDLTERTERAMMSRLSDLRHRVRAATSSYALREPETRLREAQQRVDDALRRQDDAVHDRLLEHRHRMKRALAAMQGHDPALILKKGYAIVRRVKNGRVVTTAEKLKPGQHVRTEFIDGTVRSVITDDAPDLFEGA
ncbi:exodeoxyribonuclease VII large subunit [bacterium]|nr:exodeoxyribonuclease VII large subunit [bacterium]